MTTFHFNTAKVQGRSMQPTLNPHTDRKTLDILLISIRNPFKKQNLTPGNIIVLTHPQKRNLTLVKRIRQLGPTTVYIQRDKSSAAANSKAQGSFVDVPEGFCWVESDEPHVGIDSRHFGPVPLGLVKGKAIALIYPFDRMKLL